MKSEEGITLTSLVIYIIVMIAIITLMGTVINKFYENTNSIQADTKEILEFNKFNTYFLEEIKSKNNKVDSISDNYILFSSGNSFSLLNNKIYFNDTLVCERVEEFTVAQGINGDGTDKDVVYVTLKFENFTKSINYKVEDIY